MKQYRGKSPEAIVARPRCVALVVLPPALARRAVLFDRAPRLLSRTLLSVCCFVLEETKRNPSKSVSRSIAQWRTPGRGPVVLAIRMVALAQELGPHGHVPRLARPRPYRDMKQARWKTIRGGRLPLAVSAGT